jgi:hypothetical protein
VPALIVISALHTRVIFSATCCGINPTLASARATAASQSRYF